MQRKHATTRSTVSLPGIADDHSVRDLHAIDAVTGTPTIVSISDIHGYYEAARSALTAVGEVRDPVVTVGDDDALHWAGSNYLLVFNGDLIDRGDKNERVLRMALRLQREAPPGRVRLHLGNHEMAVILPEILNWPRTYSGRLSQADRAAFVEQIHAGIWQVAFEGYEYTYSHAGRTSSFEAVAVNEQLHSCTIELQEGLSNGRYDTVQQAIPERYDTIFGLDGNGRGPDAGLLWMDLAHMPQDAPAQIVGHSRQPEVIRKGAVVCQNTIRSNLNLHGGEAVVVESPDGLIAIGRDRSGAATVYEPDQR